MTAGATTGGINFALALGGTIGGTIRDAATGAGVSGVSVQDYRASGTSRTFAGSASTGSTGTYTVAGLPTGTYYVYTSASGGYVNEVYNNVPCTGGCSTSQFPTARAVSVTQEDTTAGIDFDAPDKQPVHFILLFVTPAGQFQEHLRLLARYSALFQNDAATQALANAKDALELDRVLREHLA